MCCRPGGWRSRSAPLTCFTDLIGYAFTDASRFSVTIDRGVMVETPGPVPLCFDRSRARIIQEREGERDSVRIIPVWRSLPGT